jgi:hypothetical protein
MVNDMGTYAAELRRTGRWQERIALIERYGGRWDFGGTGGG